MLEGVRTVVYRAENLDAARVWYTDLLGHEPYFEAPFYVGFSVGDNELGLDPDTSEGRGPGGHTAYWGVADIDAAYDRLIELGAKPHRAIQEVGGGIRVATVLDPFGNVLGLIDIPDETER